MDITLINRKLKDLYGSDLLGQPIFRVVWSDDQIEKRFGEFEDFIPGTNVLVRRVKEVRECKKYAFLNPPEYVLEKLFHNQHNDEILDNSTLQPSRFTYEPLWTFGYESDGTCRKPVWRAIELLIHWHLNPNKLMPGEMNDKEFDKAREDEKLMTELLNTHMKQDAFTMSIHDGDTVILNNMDMFKKEN